MIYLRAISRKTAWPQGFPFDVPSIATLPRIEFASLTFLVGENGAGKSTLLEGIAAGIGAIAVGGTDVERDETLAPARLLAPHLRFDWAHKTGRGFFLRAEDFFNFSRRLNQTTAELEAIIARYREELADSPDDVGIKRAIGYISGQKAALTQRYGDNLDASSHGESFMRVFQERLTPNGLYLLDEPEAALSPLRQLSLLSMLKSAVADGCQFIIATHAPILMAFPDAQILNFDACPIAPARYEELQHVTLTRAFLQHPEAFLRRL